MTHQLEHTEAPQTKTRRPPAPLTGKWIAVAAGAWVASTLLCVVIVVYAVGPLLQARDQRSLVNTLKTTVDQSAGAVNNSLFGVAAPTKPIPTGDPVGLLEIGSVGVQLAVAEGVDPTTTQSGPGHAPGTAGPGQPGNAVIVGRKSGFGGAFAHVDKLRNGDYIVVTTAQGRSLYIVDAVTHGELNADTVYGPSKDNRLTLVTSDSALPWNSGGSVVVTAIMKTQPFVPTPQGARSDNSTGTGGDGGQWPLVLLLSLGLALTGAAATLMYRQWTPMATYVITTPILVSLVVFNSLAVAELFPAWL